MASGAESSALSGPLSFTCRAKSRRGSASKVGSESREICGGHGEHPLHPVFYDGNE